MNAYPGTLGTSTSWCSLLDRPHDINNDTNNSSDLYRTCFFEVDMNALYKGWLNSYWSKVAELYHEELICDFLFCFPFALYSHYISNPDDLPGLTHTFMPDRRFKERNGQLNFWERTIDIFAKMFLPRHQMWLNLGKEEESLEEWIEWRERSSGSGSCRGADM